MIEWIPPALLLGLVVSVSYAGLLHLWGGRSLRELLLYLAASASGFLVGQLLGVLLQLPLPRIGQVHMVEASVFAWLALVGARELAGGRRLPSP